MGQYSGRNHWILPHLPR